MSRIASVATETGTTQCGRKFRRLLRFSQPSWAGCQLFAFASADTAWKTLQSNIVYQIQKDSIDLAKDYKDAKVGPGAIIAKLHSIYYQRQKAIIDDQLWPMLNYEYCRMMQSDKALQDFWDKADKALYGPAFTSYVSGMRGGQKCG